MLAANLAFLAARRGARVAVLDADLQAPALHLRARRRDEAHPALRIRVRAGSMRHRGGPHRPLARARARGPGQRCTSCLRARTCRRSPRSCSRATTSRGSTEHLLRLAEELELDYLILDTHLGINRETLLSLAISDTVLVLLRPDGQDQPGRGRRSSQIAKKVGVPCCLLVPNMFSRAASTPRRWRAEHRGAARARPSPASCRGARSSRSSGARGSSRPATRTTRSPPSSSAISRAAAAGRERSRGGSA